MGEVNEIANMVFYVGDEVLGDEVLDGFLLVCRVGGVFARRECFACFAAE